MSNQKQDLKDVEHLLNYRILVFNSFDMIAMVDLDLGYLFIWAGIFPGGSDSKESACNAGDQSLTPRLRRSPGGGYGNPLQYFCLENPMDRGAWWMKVHRVAKHWTQLNQLSMHPCIFYLACRGNGLTTTSL